MQFLRLRGRIANPALRTTLRAALLLGLSTPATATTIDLPGAIQQTLAQNSELQAYPLARSREEALKLQAGVRPNPRVTLEVENAFGSGRFQQFDSAETTLALSQVIELGSKRDHRLALADTRIAQQELEYQISRLDVLAETSRRFQQLVRLQALLDLNQRQAEQTDKALDVVSTRAAAGAVARADHSRIDLRLAQLHAQRQQLQSSHELARQQLAAMWQAVPGFTEAVGDLAALPVAPGLDTVMAALDQSPAIQQQLALQRMRDAQVQLAQANGRADLDLGVGLRYLEASNDNALIFSATMPLNFSNPNRGRIAAAQSSRDLTLEQTEWSARQLQLALTQVHHQLESSLARAITLEQELLPRSRRLMHDTRVGHEQGRYSVLQWTQAQEEHFLLEQQLIETRSAAHLQLLELERITGAAMTGANTGEQP